MHLQHNAMQCSEAAGLCAAPIICPNLLSSSYYIVIIIIVVIFIIIYSITIFITTLISITKPNKLVVEKK